MTELERYAAWQRDADETAGAELRALRGDAAGIRDRFYQDLEFGTGGLRGVLGIGTNRMNVYVVRRATRGLAAYLKKKGLPLRAAVSYDSRINSRLFAEETAKALAAYGIDTWVYPRLGPTPALSWAVRVLGCGAGVMITASHNPAEYNGYKVYGADGCQITNQAAKEILREIQSFGYFDPMPPENAEGIHQIPESVLDGFLDMELARLTEPLKDLRVVYTPLNGTGLECVSRVLRKAGVGEIITVPEQEQPDGSFPTCPAPNPEAPEAMALGLRLCERQQSDLLLATDPDCDRVGAAARDGVEYKQFSGNQMGALLFDYICRTRVEHGDMPRRPVALTTIVSTEMASDIANHYGVELRRTLTGFKYIGEEIGLLERAGEADRFIFGFEESYGYLSGPHVRDKDGVNASLLICEMTAYYKQKGKTLWQVWGELERKYGIYQEKLCSFAFPGADGIQRMCGIMKRLRNEPPEMIAGAAVRQVIDYTQTEKSGLPASDVLAFYMEDGGRVTVRPSGTEPKMKGYLSVRASTRAEGEEKVRGIEGEMERLVMAAL